MRPGASGGCCFAPCLGKWAAAANLLRTWIERVKDGLLQACLCAAVEGRLCCMQLPSVQHGLNVQGPLLRHLLLRVGQCCNSACCVRVLALYALCGPSLPFAVQGPLHIRSVPAPLSVQAAGAAWRAAAAAGPGARPEGAGGMKMGRGMKRMGELGGWGRWTGLLGQRTCCLQDRYAWLAGGEPEGGVGD